MNTPLPRWVVLWLALSTIVVIWDASFVLCRPLSFPGESLGFIWSFAYTIYLEVDHGYADLENQFVASLGIISFVEAIVVAIALWAHTQAKHGLAHVLTLMATLSTGTKTVLFFLFELLSGTPSIGHNEWIPVLMFWIIPNGIWIVVPYLVVALTSRRLISATA